MKIFGVYLYRSSVFSKKPFKVRAKKNFETLMKSLIMVIMPISPTLLIVAFWYFIVFTNGFNFNGSMESIVVAAWIPTFSLLYCLLVAVVFNTVWTEYKQIRMAVKRYDVETFVDLMDEEVSPLSYILIFVCSLAILGGFMSLDYPNMISGLTIIGSTSYILFLVFFIIKEMDDPCSGLWFIKHIHSEWLNLNAKEWRKERCDTTKGNFENSIKKFTSSI